MKKLEIGDWQQRPYGERARGMATVGNRSVNFTVRRPDSYQDDGLNYVIANGWTAGKNSMRIAAITAVQHGHTAFTFDYTNHRFHNALESNATEMTTIVEALPKRARIGMLGLSMGGAVTTVTLDRVGNRVERATLVASGRYLLPEFYGSRLLIKRTMAHSLDTIHHPGKLGDGVRLLGTGALNCAERSRAVLGEVWELTHGNVHDELRRVKAESDAPVVDFVYGLHDRLLPAAAQLASIEGLPFDSVEPYQGGHNRLAIDPSLSSDIFAVDYFALADRLTS